MILRPDHPLKPVLVVDVQPTGLISALLSWEGSEIIHVGHGFTLLEATKHALDRASAPEDIRAAIFKELNEDAHDRE